jgi:hypothetical protein
MGEWKGEEWGPYKWLWTRVGGRPWTWITRDAQKGYPLLFLLGFLCAGWIIGAYVKKHWIPLLIGLIFGLLCAHFWW